MFTDNWELNVERVKLRVKDGGHNVDHKKIESRYFRSLSNFGHAARLVNSAFLIDNSKAFTRVAELINGKFPAWFRKYFNPVDFKFIQ